MNHHDDKRDSRSEEKATLGDIMHERTSSDQTDMERANRIAGIEPKAERLPLGTGYTVEHLPEEVIEPEPDLLDRSIPDKVRKDELEVAPEDPVPSPEDDFYDFDKDVYGDGTEYKP